MLVISRKVGEDFVLRLEDGREIVVRVLENDRGKVRLGVLAPPSVNVYRPESKYAPAAARGEQPCPEGSPHPQRGAGE